MERYDYLEAVKSDVRDYIAEEVEQAEWTEDRDGLEEELNETLWVCDGVTGNGSGSYTFSAWKAEEYIAHNLELLAEALQEFGGDGTEALEKGAEFCDVTIRCYLLSQAVAEALEELEENGYFDVVEE